MSYRANSIDPIKIEWFNPSAGDLSIAINAAIASLPSGTGGTIDCSGFRGVAGNAIVANPINITKPVALIFDAINIDVTCTNMFQVQDNFTLSGKDVNSTIFNLAFDGYAVTYVAPFNSRTTNDGQTALLVERIYFSGGSGCVNTSGFTGAFEGNLIVQDCTFYSMNSYALIFNSSFYYSKVLRCYFDQNYGSAFIFDNTETFFRDNVHAQAQSGGPSITFHNSNFVNVENDRFEGYTPNVNPDILINANPTYNYVAGFININKCMFRAERENWLNKARHRIEFDGYLGVQNGIVYTLVKDCYFQAPNALETSSVTRASGVTTATLICGFPSGHGLQVGDVIQTIDIPLNSSFNGQFVVTAVGTVVAASPWAQTVSWSQPGLPDVAPTTTNGFINAQNVAAIAINTGVGRFIIDGNTFAGYGSAIDDSGINAITENTRDYSGRCVYGRQNVLVGDSGYQTKEFVLGGRMFSEFVASEESPFTSFNSDYQPVEQTLIQNRLTYSETQSHWASAGGMTVTMGKSDPFGTTRAAYIQRSGTAQFVSSIGAVLEGIAATSFNVSNLPAMSYLKFWAMMGDGYGDGTPLMSVAVVATVGGNSEIIAYRTITTSSNWKQYKIPIVYPAGVTAMLIAITPGAIDAMPGDGYVAMFQLSDTDCAYVPTVASSYSDQNFSQYYQRPVTFNNGTFVGGGSTSVTNSNTTLTLSESQYINKVISVTGALTAQRAVVFPLIGGQSWVVTNSTTGGFSITCGGSTGTTVTVANGTTQSIYTDGTNFYASIITLAGDVTGPSSSNTVVSISGASPIAITPANLQWTSGTVSPMLSQASTSSTPANNFTISPQQSTAASNRTDGSMIIAMGTSLGSGTSPIFQVTAGGSNVFTTGQIAIAGTSGSIWLGNAAANNGATNAALGSDNSTFTILNTNTGGTIFTRIGAVNATQLTGSLYTLDIPTVQFDATQSSPAINQAQVTGTGTTAGTNLSITAQQGQNNTSTSANGVGGNLVLKSGAPGTGGSGNTNASNIVLNVPSPGASGTAGFVQMQQGGANIAQVGYTVGGTTSGCLYLVPSASPSSSNFTINSTSTSTSVNAVSGQVFLQVGGANTAGFGSSIITLLAPTLQWSGAIASPTLNQAVTSAGSGQTLTIQAQNATGASNNGGNLALTSGTSGSATVGSVNIQTGTNNQITISPTTTTIGVAAANTSTVLQVAGTTNLTLTSALLSWATGITTPVIKQADNTTNSATATSLTLQAQNATGTTANGGALILTSGTGTTAAGSIDLQTGGTNQITISPTTQTLGIGSGNTSTILQVGGTTNLTLTSAQLQWALGIASPTINQAAPTSDVAPTNFTLQAQGVYSSASTNVHGGNLVLEPGAGLAASNHQGDGYVTVANSAGTLLKIGVLGGQNAANYGALYAGNNASPNGSNFIMYWDNTTSTSFGPQLVRIAATSSFGVVINSSANIICNAASTQFYQQIFGAAAPLKFGNSAATSVTAGFSLSAGQQQTPVIPLTGAVAGGGITITLPNTIGAWWMFDLSAVTSLSNGITFSTGSGTTATVTAVATNSQLVTVIVSASNVVSITASALCSSASKYQQLTWNGSSWVGIGIASFSLTNADSTVTVDGSSGLNSGTVANQFVLPAATLTGAHTITLGAAGVTNEIITVVRLDATANTLAIVNGGGGGGTLYTFPVSVKRVASFIYNGTNWSMVSTSALS